MKSFRQLMTRGLFLIFFLLVFLKDIYAYIDPGTGSYVLQLLIAAFVAASFMVRLFWKKIKMFFARLFKRDSGNEG